MNPIRTAVPVAATVLAAIAPAHAQTSTWDGGGANNLWSTAGNWAGDVVPIAGDALVFTGTTNRSTSNDLTAGTAFTGMQVNTAGWTFAGNSIGISGVISQSVGGTGDNNFNLNLVLTGATQINVTNTLRLTINGGISGTGSLEKTGANTTRWNSAADSMTFSGGLTVTAGTIDLLGNNNLPYGAGKGNVSIASGAFININNSNQTLNGLNGAGTITRSGSNTRGFTLGAGDANGNFSGNLTNTGGSSSVNKIGSGTQILGGTVTSSGTGTVSGGTLQVDGTWTAGLNVNAGAKLSGNGAINGTATIATNGLLAPGASIGSLDIGNATIGGTLEIEYDGTGSGTIDLLNVANTLNITNASVNFLQILGGAPLDDGSYVFATYTTLTGSEFANVLNLPTGYEIDYAFGGNNIALVAVPEPAAALLGGLGVLGLLRRRRS